jgi:uroporphyrinogen-III synthase
MARNRRRTKKRTTAVTSRSGANAKATSAASGPRLAGRRILLTRSEDDADAWVAALESAGAVPVVLPCISAEPVESVALAAALAKSARRAAWLVFTSRRGVEGYVRLAGDELAPGARIAVVGPATAEAARSSLGRVDLVAEHGTAESLAADLIAAGAGGDGRTEPPRIVLVLAQNAGDTLERELRAAGADPRRFDVYRTVPARPLIPKRALSTFNVDAVWFASPSAVLGFMNQVEIDVDAALVAIGPSTADAMRADGLEVAAEAREPSFEGLLEATR